MTTDEAREAAANVDRLANIIRTVDGDHTAGAGAIADGIADSGFLSAIHDAGVAEGIRQAREAVARGLTDSQFSTAPYVAGVSDSVSVIDALGGEQ